MSARRSPTASAPRMPAGRSPSTCSNFERGGDAYTPNLHARLEDVKRIAREEAADGSGRLIGERAFVERLAEAEMDIQALEMIEMQVLSDLSRGRNPGAVSSSIEDQGQRDLAEARPSRRRGAGLVCRAVRTGGARTRPQRADRDAGVGDQRHAAVTSTTGPRRFMPVRTRSSAISSPRSVLGL